MMKRTTRIAAGLALLALGAALTSCSASSAGGGSKTVGLGFTATLTGDFASYGLQLRKGVDYAVDEINAAGGVDGKKLTVTSADDEGKPSNGPVVAQQFCDDSSISAVLGYSFSSVALSALPVYDQCGLPVVASAVTSPELSGASKLFFRNIFTDAYQGAAMGEFVAEHRSGGKIAVLYQQDDYGQGVAKAFSDAFKKAGGTVTSSQAYQLGTVNFGTLIDKALADDPDGVFVGGFYTEASKIATQLREAGSSAQFYGTDGSVDPGFVKLAGKSADGAIVYTAFTAAAAPDSAFVTGYKKKYGEEPGTWAALAYDAVHDVAAAMKAGKSTERSAIAEQLAQLKPVDGVTGENSFDSKGDRVGKIVFLKVEDGSFSVIDR